MIWLIKFPRKNNFVSLFVEIYIKTKFLMPNSSFKFFADKVITWTGAVRERERDRQTDKSSANSLGFETKLSERSLINIKKKRGSKIDP